MLSILNICRSFSYSAKMNPPSIVPPPPIPPANSGSSRSVNRNCSVFVGNIPYEATEDELKAIFSRVGPVVSLRLMYDKDTKHPKGFGFVEYRDIETAYSCMRNLNDVEYGGRPMRIDWADHELRSAESVQKVLRTSNAEVSERTEKIVTEKLLEFKGKITDDMMNAVNDGIKPQREIEAIIDQLSRDQLVVFLSDMQRLALNQPDAARSYLDTNPQVKFAIMCAMSRVGVSNEPFEALSASELAQARQKARVRTG